MSRSIVASFLLATAAIVGVRSQISPLGQFDLVGYSGVSTMHGILSPNTNKVVFLDRAYVSSEVKNAAGNYSYSTEYDITTNKYRPLNVITNTFCSAGGYLPDGTLVSLGGAEPDDPDGISGGYNSIRLLHPCNDDTCDWSINTPHQLGVSRWYPSVEALSDGTLLIMGGSQGGTSVNSAMINVPSIELFPPRAGVPGPLNLTFLVDTLPDNLYPVAHLLPDGNVFMFAGNQAIILSSQNLSVMTTLPNLPGPPRSYPVTGASILLPLTPANNYSAEVLICGGTSEYSINSSAITSCGRIHPLVPGAQWEMDDMPQPRLMPDILHMADGNILVINGCMLGTAGFGQCSLPTYAPNFYHASQPLGQRWTNSTPSSIARMYHSIALTVLDGRVLVSGSNPNSAPTGAGPFPTDYRVEMFTPPFLATGIPQPLLNQAPPTLSYGASFNMLITTYSQSPQIQVALQQVGFVTHSTHMSQRFVWLQVLSTGPGKVTAVAPTTSNVAPPAFYMLRVIENGIPSKALWVQLLKS